MHTRLYIQHYNRQTYIIHVLEHYNTDEIDNNEKFITNWIFVQLINSKNIKK